MDELDGATEKELLLEIFRQVRWIGHLLAVMVALAVLGAGVTTVLTIAETGR